MTTPIEEIIDNFGFLDEWEDRYKYLIELGGELSPMQDELKTTKNKVSGCTSQVWLASSIEIVGDKTLLVFTGDSDAHIVKGLVAICLAIFSRKTADEIIKINEQAIFQSIDLQEHISSQRSNGLKSLILKIRAEAAKSAEIQ